MSFLAHDYMSLLSVTFTGGRNQHNVFTNNDIQGCTTNNESETGAKLYMG